MNENELNIVYTVDDSYLPLVSISLASVQFNNKDKLINVYIATDSDDSTTNFKYLSAHHNDGRTYIHHLDCRKYDKLFKEKDMNRWGSKSYYIYWRLVAFEMLDVDYAIYIDSDVLCLKEIDFPNLNDNAVGCVLDSVHACYNKYLHISTNTPLYNTGTMFVDVRKWKENECTKKCMSYINNVSSEFMMADQDLFSLALEKYAVVINPKYNWFAGYDYYGIDRTFKLYDLDKKMFYSRDTLMGSAGDVVLYHCLDGVFGRPWVIGNDHPAKGRFEKYKMLSGWPDFSVNKKRSALFAAEKTLEKLLPDFIYCKLHNYAIRKYIEKEVKKVGIL